MTSGHGKQKQEKKVRSARKRRLEIQETKSFSRKASEFGGSLACPKKRNSTEGTDEALKDAKLKAVIGNICSGKSNLPCTNPLEYLEHSSSSNHGQSKGKRRMENEESSEKPVTIFKCSSVSLMGRRRTMEDAVTVVPGGIAGKYSFFAAYDGHGGDRVANACSERLHKLLENELQETNSENLPGHGVEPNDWKKVMAACFSRMDDEVKSDGVAEEPVGSTAVAVIVSKEEVVVANCGDSRAVLCRGGVVLPLSDDHKPERPDEKERVEAAGGRIIDWNGCRVQGVLSTSRSIGDHYLKPYVISEPEVTVTKRKELDEFLIIATDGLWDVVSSEVACVFVRRFLEGRIRRKSSTELGAAEAAAEAAAAFLAELAIAKGSRDNISIIVVQLA